MSKRIMTFTDAPEAYDGFGTKTVKVLGQRRGKTVRVVETPEEHAQWQRDRYASGLYFAFDRRMWDEYKFEGELEGTEEILFYAKTRGGRYEIKGHRSEDGTYGYREYTRGSGSGGGVGYPNEKTIRNRLAEIIKGSKYIDRINYIVVTDTLGVSELL